MRTSMMIVSLSFLVSFSTVFAGELAQKPESPECEPMLPLEMSLQIAPSNSSEQELTRESQVQEINATSGDQEVPSASYTSNKECETEEKQ